MLVLIKDGQVDRRNLRRCGLTDSDLDAILREHGHMAITDVHLGTFEAKGAVSLQGKPPQTEPAPDHRTSGSGDACS